MNNSTKIHIYMRNLKFYILHAKSFFVLCAVTSMICTIILPVKAVFALEVSNVSANYDYRSDKLTVSGQTENGVAAVAIVLTDGKSTLLFATANVEDNNSFTYTNYDSSPHIALNLTDGTYTIKAADYAGGTWTTNTFTVVIPPSSATSIAPPSPAASTTASSASTGITTGDITSLVAVPEQWESDTKQVEFYLNAEEVIKGSGNFAIVQKAGQNLQGTGAELLKSFNIDLMKKVTKTNGSVADGQVDNQYIRGNITLRIPLDATLSKLDNLSVVYIDENGNIAFLETKRVIINGVEYLEFANNHFSLYGIVQGAPGVKNSQATAKAAAAAVSQVPATGEQDTRNIGIAILLLAMALLLVNWSQKFLRAKR